MNSVPPPPDQTPNVSIPTIPQILLKNGLTVVCVQDKHLPRITVRLALPIGRTSDPVESRGLAQMVLEMLKEGTHSRSSQEIAESLDQLAIDFECDVSMEHCVVAMTMLSDQLQDGLRLLGDIVSNPSFPEVEFEKVRARWRGNLLSQRADPSFLANERIFEEIYGSHPYSRTSIPIENLDLFSCEMLKEFFRTRFSPEGAYLLLAGAINLDQAVAVAEEFFGGWTRARPVEIEFPLVRRPEEPLFALVDRPHSAQTKILTAVRTVRQSDPSHFAIKLANQVLGGSASARLFLNLREEKGYTYGAYSFQKNYKMDGLVLASANVRTEHARESVEEIFKESDRMGRQLAEERELARSKAEIIGSFIRQLETPGSIGSLEVLRLLMELPEDHYSNYIPSIRALKAEDVLSVSDRYLKSCQMVTTLVGDRKSLEEQIQDMGRVRVYDVQGSRLN
jgi:predicted Zn-dependent peptidase